nr:MAG TPA: putative nuclease [Caudoviricetes sp.]
MKKITLIIEKAEDGGYGVYSKEISGVIGYGLTENEAKEDAKEILEEQAEFYREKHGAFPEWYSKNMQIEYRYDFSGFFLAFPFFNVSKFAEEIGINASLMRKYKEGLAFASEKQKALIQEKFNEIKQKMNLVQF